MKKMEHRIKKGVLFVPIFIGGLFLFTWIIMLLWNGILPGVITGVKVISYFQAMGILVLSKILFGGSGRGHGGGGWRNKEKWMDMKEKFSGMTPEEREKFKAEWKNKCGGRWGMRPAKTDSTTDIATE
jgi:Ca2+/H+ antiporter, TMEM165/GDT1 family